METYFSLIFWRKAAERAIKSAGQGVVYVLTLGFTAGVAAGATTDAASKMQLQAVNAFLVDWKAVLGTLVGMAVLSFGTSIGTAKIGPADDPGAV